MKRIKWQFWSCLWSVALFILTIGGLVVQAKASDFETIAKAKTLLKVELVGENFFKEFKCVTQFVGKRTKENFKAAIEEVKLFLEKNLDEELRGGELTQIKTFSMLAQRFYERQGKEDLDLHSMKKIVLMLRPYEVEITSHFLDLQELYREVLFQRGGFFETVEEDFLTETRSVFYFSDGLDRPYLVPNQVNWVLRLSKKYAIVGEEFKGYLDRAVLWEQKQKKRESLSSTNSLCGETLSIDSHSDQEPAPKRKWGNKRFHSHVGFSSHYSIYKQKYGSGKKGGRPRSSSW